MSTHGILGYAALFSVNLGKAIQFALKYYRVLGLSYVLEVVELDSRVELCAIESMPLGAMGRFIAEGLLASLHSIAQFLLRERLQGVEVGFSHAVPSYIAHYEQIFGVPVAFERPYHYLSIPRPIWRSRWP